MLPLTGPGLEAERNSRDLAALSLLLLLLLLPLLPLRLRGFCGILLAPDEDMEVSDRTRDVSGNRSGVTGGEKRHSSVKPGVVRAK